MTAFEGGGRREKCSLLLSLFLNCSHPRLPKFSPFSYPLSFDSNLSSRRPPRMLHLNKWRKRERNTQDFAMDRKIIPQNRHPFSYVTRIPIPQPKTRIKFPNPKLLLKTMQKRFRCGCNMNSSDEDNEQQQQCCTKMRTQKTRKKPGKLLTTKIRSVFINAFSGMRTPDGGNLMKSETESDTVVGKHGSSGHLNGAPSKAMVTDGWKSRTGRFLGKILRREFDEDINSKQEEREGEELCKKRILMGGKCKPLSLSDILEYDQNGIW